MVLFGDSITEGSMSASYVEELAHRMGADGHRFQNAGVGGDTAFNLLQRVARVVAAQPDAVVTMVGTNDLQAYLRGGKPTWIMQQLRKLPQPMTLDWYVELVRQIVETLQNDTHAALALCSIPVMGEDLDDRANDAVRLFNRALEGSPRSSTLPTSRCTRRWRRPCDRTRESASCPSTSAPWGGASCAPSSTTSSASAAGTRSRSAKA